MLATRPDAVPEPEPATLPAALAHSSKLPQSSPDYRHSSSKLPQAPQRPLTSATPYLPRCSSTPKSLSGRGLMLAQMPPRASLTGSFSVSDENNVVVCPLRNHDGSACRKRCTGVGFLSALLCSSSAPLPSSSPLFPPTDQPAPGETLSLHARAHPARPPRALHLKAPSHRGELHADGQHPATAHTTAPAAPHNNWPRLVPMSTQRSRGLTQWQGYEVGEHNAFFHDQYGSITPRTSDELRRPSLLPAATAAAALASLHNHRPEYDGWDSDPVPCSPTHTHSLSLYVFLYANMTVLAGCHIGTRLQDLPTPRPFCADRLGTHIHCGRRTLLYDHLAAA